MKDRTVYIKGENRTTYVPYEKTINITEERAPTDKSIELFDEFLHKAYKYIIDSFEIKNNILNDIQIYIIASPASISKTLAYKYKLNSIEVYDKIEIDGYLRLSREDIGKRVYEEISNKISRELIMNTKEIKDFILNPIY